jgi:glyoxylase-like metal-dependent hydrolase (beta-lactamase superfamily II)
MKSMILRAAAAALLLAAVGVAVARRQEKPEIEPPLKVAEGVWMMQTHDIGKYGSNVSWIEFDRFVVVVDTAFPLGAERALTHIRETTGGKPIRYAVLTHYHADHAFGNEIFAREGTIIVSHENARRDFLARNLEQYADRARNDPAAARYKALAPDLTFADSMVIDDGKRRAELYHYGHAHTTGCVFTWLPKEKILLTGDACVNGPFNYMGDSDSASWIQVLEKAQELKPAKVLPGHGASAGGDLLETQKAYFQELRAQVGRLAAQGKTLAEVQAAVDIPAWKKWTGEAKMNASNIAHVFGELSRKRE